MELFICQALYSYYLFSQARPLLSSRDKGLRWLGCGRLYSSSRTLLINRFIISFSASVIQKFTLCLRISSGSFGRPAFGLLPPQVIVLAPFLFIITEVFCFVNPYVQGFTIVTITRASLNSCGLCASNGKKSCVFM